MSVAWATKNVTDAKDKRQVGHTAVVPIGNNGGPQALVIHQNQRHQPAAQYVAKSIANHGNQQQAAEQQQEQEVCFYIYLLFRKLFLSFEYSNNNGHNNRILCICFIFVYSLLYYRYILLI